VTSPKLKTPEVWGPISGEALGEGQTLTVTNAVSDGNVGDVKYRFEWSTSEDFPENELTGAKEDIDQDGGGTTSYRIADVLRPNVKYYWRARAYTASLTTDWTPTESFVTPNVGHCLPGPDIYDPLTDGRSLCGSPVGGRFIAGRGWQSIIGTDGLNYDIATCSDCTVEFDTTNFNKKEGESLNRDLKWLSMGDSSTYGDFIAFRNHPWKMHVEQRGDGDGTGMKLIWRNGDAGEGDPGDHTAKLDSGPNWNPSTIYHFIVRWSGGAGFTIQVGETQPDGSIANLRTWFQDGFGGHPYAPPNHRIQLGCSARDESFFDSAIWSNVKIRHN